MCGVLSSRRQTSRRRWFVLAHFFSPQTPQRHLPHRGNPIDWPRGCAWALCVRVSHMETPLLVLFLVSLSLSLSPFTPWTQTRPRPIHTSSMPPPPLLSLSPRLAPRLHTPTWSHRQAIVHWTHPAAGTHALWLPVFPPLTLTLRLFPLPTPHPRSTGRRESTTQASPISTPRLQYDQTSSPPLARGGGLAAPERGRRGRGQAPGTYLCLCLVLPAALRRKKGGECIPRSATCRPKALTHARFPPPFAHPYHPTPTQTALPPTGRTHHDVV